MSVTAASLRAWLALALGVGALLIALWTVLPPPTYALLVVAVAAPEIGVWLACAALLAALLALPDVRHEWRARVALACAVLVLGLAAVPFLRYDEAQQRFASAMSAALGRDALEHVPDAVRRALRPAPLDVRELFFGLDPGEPRIARDRAIPTSGETALSLDVYRPEAHGRFPVVVQIYGGAWQRGTPGDNARFASYLAMQGYVVFAIDYRHAPQWQFPAQFEDVKTTLAWIARHADEYDADATRIAVIGRSSGAELALLAAYAQDAVPVSAVVSYYGPVDLVRSYREPPRPDPLHVRAVAESYLGGSPDAQPARYAAASPISYVTRALPPTLLVYGGRDQVVESRFGMQLDERLRETGTVSVLLVIPWAEHAFDAVSGGPSAQLTLYHTERFLAWALYRR